MACFAREGFGAQFGFCEERGFVDFAESMGGFAVGEEGC